MHQQRAILTFPKDKIGEPIMSRLVRDIGVEINMIHANITPEEDGQIYAILSGSESEVAGAFEYLERVGVRVLVPAHNLIFDETRCVGCGACIGHCPPQAFSFEPESATVRFEEEKCIACNLCIPVCGYGALESVSEYLHRTGEV